MVHGGVEVVVWFDGMAAVVGLQQWLVFSWHWHCGVGLGVGGRAL